MESDQLNQFELLSQKVETLLDKFETKLGRKLVIMSQDSDKDIASRAFRIVGVFKAEMEAY